MAEPISPPANERVHRLWETFDQRTPDEAKALAVDFLRDQPLDRAVRAAFVEILCFLEQWERAENQADVVAGREQHDSLGQHADLLRRLTRGERWRASVMSGQAIPSRPPSSEANWDEDTERRLSMLVAHATGSTQEFETRAAAIAMQPGWRCEVAGGGKGELRDEDDRLGSTLEGITRHGEYVWIPLQMIMELRLSRMGGACDRLWRRAFVQLTDAVGMALYIPIRYPESSRAGDPILIRGEARDRITGWGSIFAAAGHRCFMFGEDRIPMAKLGTIRGVKEPEDAQ
ncbi:MAG: type VI secretion system accessory protein TagJ [Phycisphaerales bacterium]